MTISRQLILATGIVGFAGSAQAALSVCNDTDFVQSVSIGYEGPSNWMSKGWWNIQPNDCAVVVGGALAKRYYYIRAEVNGGDFAGEGYMFCTTPQEYEIQGDTDCEGRGYDNESFREIDTGASATDFTYRLTGGQGETPPRNDEGPGTGNTDEVGLTICNSTGDVQSVSIGYENAEGFLSEGWWNIEPDDCAKVLGGKLEQRYYYYRAEVNAGDFAGEGFMFCTSPEVYSIQGDSNCESRGYDTESFSEIDTGPAAQGFTFYISADGSTTPPPRNDPPPVVNTTGAGIRVCNETGYVQSVTFGFEGAEDWTSMGWWNLEPDDCVEPKLDGVNRRYVFFRSELAGGEFVGENYFFCTSPEPFTIVGDSNCGARGYDRAAFRELDTGGTTGMYELTLLESDLFAAPDVSPGNDRPTFPPVEEDTVETDPDTPIFDFDLPGDEADTPVTPEDPETDLTSTDTDFGPSDDVTDVVDTPVEDTPFADDAPVKEDPPAVTDTTVVDTPPGFDDLPEDEPEVSDPPAFEDEIEEEEEEAPKPPRRGGSRGG